MPFAFEQLFEVLSFVPFERLFVWQEPNINEKNQTRLVEYETLTLNITIQLFGRLLSDI